MDLLDAIKCRRSVREYSAEPISKEALISIVDAARFAPTARNIQPWEFVIVTDKLRLQELAVMVSPNGAFLKGANACVAVFSGETKYYLEDGSCATQNILLAATSLGIGSCWIAGDKKDYCQRVADYLQAPKRLKLVSIIALGYPAGGNILSVAKKNDLIGILHWEKF